MDKIETPEEFARKMSLVHDEVASDGTFDPPINKWSAMLTARDALIRADERQKAAGWISVKERLPEVGQLVAYSRDTGDRQIVDAVYWSYEEEKYMPPRWNNITHWMPLPEPPAIMAEPEEAMK